MNTRRVAYGNLIGPTGDRENRGLRRPLQVILVRGVTTIAQPLLQGHQVWMDEKSGIALTLKTGVPSCQVEDEEGRIHLLLHLPIEDENEDRWCLWRQDQAGFDFSVLSHK